MAVVRPFSVQDAHKLSKSFDTWNEFPPCSGDPLYTADLVLVFSQSLENSTHAMDVMQEVGGIFKDTDGFGGCFQRVLGFGCNIDESVDIYSPGRLDGLWVNGPNRAFERTFRALQGKGYDYYYQMEMDSVPVQSLWLDSLVQESQNFAVLGSQYKGYKWDAFYSELPPSLRTHINGNAVYNTSHIVLERLVTALEQEAHTAGNTVPYDLRMTQILEEVQTGQPVPIESVSGLPLPPAHSGLLSDLDVDLQQAIRGTNLIGNYTATNLVPDFLDSEVIVHGAFMHQPWNSSYMGNVSLVVSDWNPSNIHFLLESLQTSSHPFNEVVVMVPEGFEDNSTRWVGDTPIQFVSRKKSTAWTDVCSAPIKNPWVMKTSSYFQLRKKVPLMTQDGKPVITFSYPSKETCYKFQSCVEDLKSSKLIDPKVNRVFDEADMVYERRTLRKFCSYVNHINQRPSPTPYVSYLDVMGKTDNLYRLSERRVEGLLAPFLRVSESLLPSQLKGRRLQSSNSSNVCADLAVYKTCSSAGCQWIERTSSCRSSPNSIEEQRRNVPPPKSRPKYITALISIAIAGASVILIALLYVAYKKQGGGSGAGGADSLEPLDGSRNASGGARSDVDSSLLLASEFEYSRNDGSIQDIELNDGDFEETSQGVEFIQN